MPLTTDSALEVGPTWSRQLGQRLPEVPFNHNCSMTNTRMNWFHWILHDFRAIILHLKAATDLRRKRFCLLSYCINGDVVYGMLLSLKKQGIQNFILLQAPHVLGQILYPHWIISTITVRNQTYYDTAKHTQLLCFWSFIPQVRMLSLNCCVIYCQHLQVAADSQVKTEMLLRVALSSKICITSPNLQEMRALLQNPQMWKATLKAVITSLAPSKGKSAMWTTFITLYKSTINLPSVLFSDYWKEKQ